MPSKNIAVFFGDETFPKKGRGRSSKEWEASVGRLANVLKELDIHHAYLPSYKGTNIIAGHIFKKLGIPYTLVIPHPSFGSNSTIRSKAKLAEVALMADKTIAFGDKEDDSDLILNISEVKEDFVDYIRKHCNSIIIASDKKGMTKKLERLLREFPEDAFTQIFTTHY